MDDYLDGYLVKSIEPAVPASRLQHWAGLQKFEQAMNTELKPEFAANPVEGPPKMEKTNFEMQLIPLFLEDAPQRMEVMRTALQAKDARVLGRAAHTLKSSSALMGAAQMSLLCEILEGIGESGSIEDARVIFAQLEDEFEIVRQSLEIKASPASGTIVVG